MRYLLTLDAKKQKSRELKPFVAFTEFLLSLGFVEVQPTSFVLNFGENFDINELDGLIRQELPTHCSYLLLPATGVHGSISLPEEQAIVWI